MAHRILKSAQACAPVAAPRRAAVIDCSTRCSTSVCNSIPGPSNQQQRVPRPQHASADQCLVDGDVALTGRRAVLMVAAVAALSSCLPAQAAGFKKELKKRKLADEDFLLSDDVGLRIHELEAGNQGPEIQPGDRVLVHFDVLYKGVDVVSSRSARLLGGNRTIAEPYEYIVGERVSAQPVKKISEGAGGLFAGSGGPKPPPALSRATIGMRKGGKRMVLVDDPELGYGAKGIQELPPNTNFQLRVEVLEVIKKA